MSETKEMLFSLQRFQILSLFTNPAAERNVTPSYAFAWADNIYPFLNDGAPWHKPYADCFAIQEEQLDELHQFLCDRWDSKKLISFYELEDHYGVSGSARPGPVWSRYGLVAACRYIYLQEFHFDKAFWSALLENGKCPSEAHIISSPYTAEHVYFE
ncbi:hypothetical protein [Halomonas faecis]|uniref:hypothetical protein n=1 Tax=Halomonas faecis TaxID=1562110 RepID=UPI0013D1E7DF|nr:hypothetical protein [Halomonas faecis]